MVFYLAGLQNLDGSLYEAAKIDGAGAVKRFFKLTVPLLLLFTGPCTLLHGIRANKVMESGIRLLAIGDFK